MDKGNLPHFGKCCALGQIALRCPNCARSQSILCTIFTHFRKYLQLEKLSSSTLNISPSWKLQRHSPNTILLRLQWVSLQHVQVRFCFIFFLKKKSLTKRNRMKGPYWQAHPETPLGLMHIAVCNTALGRRVVQHHPKPRMQDFLELRVRFHTNPKFSSLPQNQSSSLPVLPV